MFDELTIDLGRPAGRRWQLTGEQREHGRALLWAYRADLGLDAASCAFLVSAAKDVVDGDHWEEMESLAGELSLPVNDIAICNLYYDALKVVFGRAFGCTAFAVDAPGGILHARNLDWWTENSALARFTTINRFVGGAAGEFTTIGWPGFVGVFSGIAPGRFAVTLNAVLSTEPGRIATPVVFLLRRVFEQARTFEEARRVLSESAIPCDCLLLLTGVLPGELAVIERTPSRHAIRGPQSGCVFVTNGYRMIDGGVGGSSELLATWCERFERIEGLVQSSRPEDAEGCLRYLSDPGVRMKMTVQQMVFRAATGEIWTQFPPPIEAAHNSLKSG